MDRLSETRRRPGRSDTTIGVPRNPLPPRLLPVLYIAIAHIALTFAFAAVAWDPAAVAGFFYHPRMLAVVHLVTLGWITASILGTLYIVSPVALRMTLPATWVDYTAFLLVTIGVIGMVGHFWIAEYRGMPWSGATVAAGVLVVALRVAGPLRRAPIPVAVRWHIALAFLNIALAATMGVVLGQNRVRPVLPGYVLDHVVAHAHLAAVGWASLMVVGVGYRLLPMVLPAEMPGGSRLFFTAVCLEIGAVGLFLSLFLHLGQGWVFALLIVAGFGAFLSNVAWMLRHPRPRPPAVRTPDPAVLHAAAAFASLVLSCALGLWLTVAPASATTNRAAMAYGVLGLVGFLAQMIVGMEGRVLPIFAWYWAFENSQGREPVPSPHEMPWRAAQLLGFVLWLVGVPALAAGLAFDGLSIVRSGATALLAAALLDSAQVTVILRHAYRHTRSAAGPLR